MERPDDDLAREADFTVASWRTPQAEYKGFAAHVLALCALALWLLWAALPDRLLHALGVWYYPSRWWAVATPAWVLALMVFGYVALFAANTELETLPLGDRRCVVDDSAVVANNPRYLYQPTNGVWDLPLSEVNRVLYSD